MKRRETERDEILKSSNFKSSNTVKKKREKKPQACCISSRINISVFLPGCSACDSATSNPVRSAQVTAKFCIMTFMFHIAHFARKHLLIYTSCNTQSNISFYREPRLCPSAENRFQLFKIPMMQAASVN